MLNKRGPQALQKNNLSNYCIMTLWFIVFDFESNPVSFLKQEKTDRRYSI